MRKKVVEDLLFFGRVISAALLICGYIVMGVLVGRWLQSKGYPPWTLIACALLGAIIGLWQAWLFIRPLIENRRE